MLRFRDSFCSPIFHIVRVMTVKMTREALADSSVVVNVSELGFKQTQALQTDLIVFDPLEMCHKLVISDILV